VFRNPGANGQWQALTEPAGFDAAPKKRHRGCAFADFDGDGRIDVVTTALGAEAEVWMNQTQTSGHWLGIALVGTKSNRDGIGTRIKLVSKTVGAQYNHMTTSTGYASSSNGPVHFGLGPDARADLIEIHWPSGRVQELKNVAADRILKVTEPR
jgi:enediyne biosynthesis protein E4